MNRRSFLKGAIALAISPGVVFSGEVKRGDIPSIKFLGNTDSSTDLDAFQMAITKSAAKAFDIPYSLLAEQLKFSRYHPAKYLNPMRE